MKLEEKEHFTLTEAFELINCNVNKKEVTDACIKDIGFLASVITLNDEIEVIVKLNNEIYQITKHSFANDYVLINMT